MKTEKHYASTSDIILNGKYCPFNSYCLDMIPNNMGINLSCVAGISWEKRDDGQLTTITIHFIPNEEGDPRINLDL